MPIRVVCSGTIPYAAGMAAFTPEGERDWVGSEWDPHYPAGDPTLRPGLVFLAADAIWVVIDVADERVRYARVTPGERAGTVEVRRVGPNAVEVVYDLTALDVAADADLQAFADGFETMLDEWRRALVATGAA